MILNNHHYNPLPVVFNLLSEREKNSDVVCVIKKELFKAGIVPEDDQEFDQVLNLLEETRIRAYGKE